MTKRSSVNDLIEILREFPLKNNNLNEKTTLNESINLFGSLMLQRVRSLLLDHYPYADFTNLSENSLFNNEKSIIIEQSQFNNLIMENDITYPTEKINIIS